MRALDDGRARLDVTGGAVRRQAERVGDARAQSGDLHGVLSVCGCEDDARVSECRAPRRRSPPLERVKKTLCVKTRVVNRHLCARILRVLGLRRLVALPRLCITTTVVRYDDSTMPVDDDDDDRLVRDAEGSRDGSLGGLFGASRLDNVGGVGGEFIAL